jgi:uncharacterized protein YqgC (DUF456 family)
MTARIFVRLTKQTDQGCFLTVAEAVVFLIFGADFIATIFFGAQKSGAAAIHSFAT